MRSMSDFEGEGHFEHLFPKGQIWFSPKEAGNIIGRSDQFMRDCFYSGKIPGHVSNGVMLRNGETKSYILFQRESIITYLINSANYTPKDFMEALEGIIRNRSHLQLLHIEKLVNELLYSQMPHR